MEEIGLSKKTTVCLIADSFPPLRNSAAVQLGDLSLEFKKQGYDLTVITPDSEMSKSSCISSWMGIQLLRLKSPKTKDVGYLRRLFGEVALSFVLFLNFKRSTLSKTTWDYVIWYSPTIFLGFLANSIKESSRCKGYLIVRDIFPEWAVDLGLIKRGPLFFFLKAFERYQYKAADFIGVQTPSNLHYFKRFPEGVWSKVETLENWLAAPGRSNCSISVEKTILAGRKIFVYAGNMGIAQGIDLLLELATIFEGHSQFGFLFVGRGTEAKRLSAEASKRKLTNVLFFDAIDSLAIPALYAQCHVGLITLDKRHKTDNIPGKFLSYMQSGLPVLASVNPGNDLAALIQEERVGRVSTTESAEEMRVLALDLMAELELGNQIQTRCRELAHKRYSPEIAVKKIMARIQS